MQASSTFLLPFLKHCRFLPPQAFLSSPPKCLLCCLREVSTSDIYSNHSLRSTAANGGCRVTPRTATFSHLMNARPPAGKHRCIDSLCPVLLGHPCSFKPRNQFKTLVPPQTTLNQTVEAGRRRWEHLGEFRWRVKKFICLD